jgi:hypothetical protein
MKKLIFYSVTVFLSLTALSIHSTSDEISVSREEIDKLLKSYNADIEKKAVRKKRKKHNQAIRIFTKAKRKYGDDFECIKRVFDGAKKECLESRVYKKSSNKYARYFEKIKEIRNKADKAEFEVDPNEKIDASLNVKEIIKQMRSLQAEFIRLFADRIHSDRRSQI